MNPPAAILLYLSALVVLVFGVGWVSSKVKLSPELRRKVVHIGMGLASLTFPLVFQTLVPVLALAALSALLLLFLRRFPSLKCSGSIHGVTRKTCGDFYFVLGILGAFALAGTHPQIYTIAVLTLTFADPAAAFVGQWLSPRIPHRKSLAGSIAFFVVAFACAFIPLATSPLASTAALLAFGFAVFLTGVEALCLRGSDNLTIPIAGSLFFLVPLSIQIVAPAALLAVTLSTYHHERRRLTPSA